MKIKHIVSLTFSRPDTYGNSEVIGTYVNAETGKRVSFKRVPESNMRSVIYILSGNKWEANYFFTTRTIGIRDFNRQAKSAEFLDLGCNPEEIAKQILELTK